MSRKFVHPTKKRKNVSSEENVPIAVMAKLCGEDFVEIDDTLSITEGFVNKLLSKRKLTEKNHLLFINGTLRIPNLHYKIYEDYFINMERGCQPSWGDNIYLFFK